MQGNLKMEMTVRFHLSSRPFLLAKTTTSEKRLCMKVGCGAYLPGFALIAIGLDP